MNPILWSRMYSVQETLIYRIYRPETEIQLLIRISKRRKQSESFPLVYSNWDFSLIAWVYFHTKFWSQLRRDYPLNLSILIRGGKETNKDALSNGEWSGQSSSWKSVTHACNRIVSFRRCVSYFACGKSIERWHQRGWESRLPTGWLSDVRQPVFESSCLGLQL